MDCAKGVVCCLIPGMRGKLRRDREKKTRIERLREKMQQLCRLQVSPNYQVKRDRILANIPFDYSRIVVIWAPSDKIIRAHVIKKLLSYGVITLMQERWSASEKGERIWRGFLVEYARKSETLKAAFDLPSHFMGLRSTMLETVVFTLADCELLHPECRVGTTKVVISRRNPLKTEEIDDLHKTLHSYGPVETFFYNNRRTTLGSLGEVTYPYLTQAYLAMIMMDGLVFSGGILKAVINKTQKEKEILADAKHCIVFLFQCDFPK